MQGEIYHDVKARVRYSGQFCFRGLAGGSDQIRQPPEVVDSLQDDFIHGYGDLLA